MPLDAGNFPETQTHLYLAVLEDKMPSGVSRPLRFAKWVLLEKNRLREVENAAPQKQEIIQNTR